MPAVTLRRDGTPLDSKKAFSWSYSRLKNYEICALRYLETDVKKSTAPEESDNLIWGDRVHKTAAEHLDKGVPLPPDVEKTLAPWMARLKATPGKILVEQKYALMRDLTPCGYFDKGVWFRGVADVLKLVDDVALAGDWKTGKITPDSVQLALMAASVFAHHPEINTIRTEFIWLQEDATTREDFQRSDLPTIWSKLFPRIAPLEHSYNTGTYLPRPNKLCAMYCKVESCVHHGKRY